MYRMICPTCGNNLTENDRFCPTCGTPSDPAAEEFDDIMQEASALINDSSERGGKKAASQPDPTIYSNPVPLVQKANKTRKLLKILIPILVVLLLAGAAFGLYTWADTTYEQASACLL